MDYDQAVAIAHDADSLPFALLCEKYIQFVGITENTPNWMSQLLVTGGDHGHGNVKIDGKPMSFQRALHASMGLVTECSELVTISLPAFTNPLAKTSRSHIIEEIGDIFYYTALMKSALDQMDYKVGLDVMLQAGQSLAGPSAPDILKLSIDALNRSISILDLFKKDLYGKNKILTASQISSRLAECLFSIKLIILALFNEHPTVTPRSIMAENIKKLANRYIEKFGR
jgi:hypothetical protein